MIKQKAVSDQPWTVHPEIHQGIQGTGVRDVDATLKQRLFGRLKHSGGSLSLAAQPKELL